MTRAVATIALLAALVGSCLAQEAKPDPTLTQTLEWLKEKVPLSAGHYIVQNKNNPFAIGTIGESKDVTLRTAPTRFETCTVVFELTEVEVWAKFPNNPITETTRYTVPLSEVSEVEVLKVDIPLEFSEDFKVVKSWPVWAVFLDAKSDVILEETHRDIGNTTKSSTRHSAPIGYTDEALAKRVSQAFKHAADLCRGREPF
jgi:hypothetical protein